MKMSWLFVKPICFFSESVDGITEVYHGWTTTVEIVITIAVCAAVVTMSIVSMAVVVIVTIIIVVIDISSIDTIAIIIFTSVLSF